MQITLGMKRQFLQLQQNELVVPWVQEGSGNVLCLLGSMSWPIPPLCVHHHSHCPLNTHHKVFFRSP
jgi:hypothetical protein